MLDLLMVNRTQRYQSWTFNLRENTYKPYSKPDNQTVYTNVNSNHLPSTTREFAKSSSKRLLELSYNKETFKESNTTLE